MNAIVIGGGPAGSLAATLLARGGARVALIEQHRFPRNKVCGECLSSLGRHVLRRHGLEQRLAVIGREIVAADLFGLDSHVRLRLPSPMLGVSRSAMDAALLSAAAAAGARVWQPARVESVTTTLQGATVRVRDLSCNEVTTEEADVVLVADGRGALLKNRPGATDELGIKAHFVTVTADPAAVTLYGGLNCYGGVAPIEDNKWNVAFSVSRQLVSTARGDLAALWAKLIDRSPAMARQFARAERVGDWLAAPLPRHEPNQRWQPHVIPIGAAACAIEPIGGEGMGTALRSAELAAEAVLNDDLASLPVAYSRLWRIRSLFCRLGGRTLADPELSGGLPLARHPLISGAAMRLVGK